MKFHKKLVEGIQRLFSREKPFVFSEELCDVVLVVKPNDANTYRSAHPTTRLTYIICLEEYLAKTDEGRSIERYTPAKNELQIDIERARENGAF